MGTRKIASIVTVSKIEEIEGKSFIALVSFEECGWQVIGSKSLSVGEKVLYVEYDSVLPETMLSKMNDQETAVNLKKRCWSNKWNGCVIRAMKMAGKVSYGILFRWDEVSNLLTEKDWVAGNDVTAKLGVMAKADDFTQIQKKEKPGFFKKWWSIFLWKVFKIKKKKSGLGEWVPFLNRTDETRIQALPSSILDELQHQGCYITEKIDGQSASYSIFKGKFYICSRNQCLYNKPLKKAIKELIPANAPKQADKFIATACKYDIARRMMDVQGDYFGGNDWALQGEQAGPGIQGNPCQLATIELFVFNVFNITDQKYLCNKDIEDVVKMMSERGRFEATPMQMVPYIKMPNGVSNLVHFCWKSVQELENLAKGPTFNGKGKHREGIVIRKLNLDRGKGYMPDPARGMSNMYSFKVINPDFILSKKD